VSESQIVGSMAVTGLSVYLGALASGNNPGVKPAVGIVVTGAGLLFASTIPAAAPIASRFAAVIATTAVLTSGYYLAKGIGRYLGTPAPKPAVYEPRD